MKAWLLSAVLLALSLLPSRAELLIYSLSFDSTGPEVNFTSFNGGYLVVDEDALSFQSIIILDDPDTGAPYYTTSLLSGSYFELFSEGGGSIHAVMNGTSGGDDVVENIAFQITGKTSGDVDVGPGVSLRVAKKMRGFLLANSEEVISTDEDTGDSSVEYGFAGSSKVTAKFDQNSTKDANNSRLDADSAVTAITATLERNGIGPEPTPSPTPDTEE